MPQYFKNILLIIIVSAFFSCKKDEMVKGQSYDALILNAEKHLLAKALDSASIYFDSAFKKQSKMLAFDMNNALILAVKTNNWNQALTWSERLAKKGVGLPYFEKNTFKAFRETKQWKKFIVSFEGYQLYFENHSDIEMIDSLEILIDIDQQAYCLLPAKKIDLSNVFDKTIFLDSLLFRLINIKGFPTEDKVGANVYDDSLISPLPKFHALYRHSYQANSNLVKSFLNDAVENGDFKKAVYENSLIGDNADYNLVNCKIYEFKYLKKSSIDNFFKEKLVFQNSIEPDYRFYAPLSIFKLVGDTPANEIFDDYNYLCDYKNCEE